MGRAHLHHDGGGNGQVWCADEPRADLQRQDLNILYASVYQPEYDELQV
jgi:hypothetical protein